jgi:hypothetical protein
MQNITVDKGKLLDTLRQNREDHRLLFLKAQDKYRERVIEELDRRLADARAGRKIDIYISLPEPEDHTGSFDQAITMVEWAEGSTMDLSEKDVQRYILNKWEWQHSFAANTQSYLGSS